MSTECNSCYGTVPCSCHRVFYSSTSLSQPCMHNCIDAEHIQALETKSLPKLKSLRFIMWPAIYSQCFTVHSIEKQIQSTNPANHIVSVLCGILNKALQEHTTCTLQISMITGGCALHNCWQNATIYAWHAGDVDSACDCGCVCM